MLVTLKLGLPAVTNVAMPGREHVGTLRTDELQFRLQTTATPCQSQQHKAMKKEKDKMRKSSDDLTNTEHKQPEMLR